ncbi:HAD family hydrolase [Lentzea sp. HUAS12]|uniref:HAD family hydrolase n=1 Tax=Lentzea sp. HUAS12 TaxID=2951806 RepID=UPI00209D4DA4|nr:HAD hydrolase-like protein [Lentzea sp. HUAS12]USX49912.1 HAD hydrolase-like protein [Lentzea sp. HUAS12]
MSEADGLLLDFDGPVCSVFAGFPANVVAGQLREILAEGGHSSLPADIENTGDPFDVFRYASNLSEDDARYVEAALQAHEVEAVKSAQPNPGGHELIHIWSETGRKIAIVSNNSTAAVRSYLEKYGLLEKIDEIVSRTSFNAILLKPAPHLVINAVAALKVRAQNSVLIGDSPSDMIAARRASVHAIGYANKPEKLRLLTDSGAAAVIREMETACAAVNLGKRS